MKFHLYICMTFPSQPNSEKFYVIIYCSYSIKYVLAVGNLWGFFCVVMGVNPLLWYLLSVCVLIFAFSVAANPNCEMIEII